MTDGEVDKTIGAQVFRETYSGGRLRVYRRRLPPIRAISLERLPIEQLRLARSRKSRGDGLKQVKEDVRTRPPTIDGLFRLLQLPRYHPTDNQKARMTRTCHEFPLPLIPPVGNAKL